MLKLYRDGESGLNGFKAGSFDFGIFDIMLPVLMVFRLLKE
jgi:DNA-binding response OmpR family regulator